MATLANRYAAKYPKAIETLENGLDDSLAFYAFPQLDSRKIASTNMLERLNEEIKRRTWVVRIFSNTESCLRLVRTLAVEMHEDGIEGTRYLNMELLREHKRELHRESTDAA